MGELLEDPALRDLRHPFDDRAEGGRGIATLLGPVRLSTSVILALPPGGIEVIAGMSLPCRYGLFFSEPLVHPDTGACLGGVAWNGWTVWDRPSRRQVGLPSRKERSIRRESIERLRRRARRYGARRPPLNGCDTVLIDDGTSPWPVLLAAVRDIHSQGGRSIVLAVPCYPSSSILGLVNEVDLLCCPSVLRSVPEGRKGPWDRPLTEAEGLAKWSRRDDIGCTVHP